MDNIQSGREDVDAVVALMKARMMYGFQFKEAVRELVRRRVISSDETVTHWSVCMGVALTSAS